MSISNYREHRIRWCCTMRNTLFLVIFCSLAIWSLPHTAGAHMYFNSSESGCNANSPDPSYYFCDDFEDGDWAQTNADTSGGKLSAANDGWALSIYKTWPDPQGTGYGRCGSKGAVGTNCTATSATISTGGIMGKHWFSPNERAVDEIYIRYYLKRLPGFSLGHQKMIMLQNENSYQCCVLMSAFSDPCQIATDSYFDIGWMDQNQGNAICLQPGNWYYIEYHIKLNTPGQANGIMELWVDDCGTNGLGCTGPGTLRTRYTNRVFRDLTTQTITTFWLENWSNPSSSGEEHYDQMIVASRRIGPMLRSTNATPPPPVTGLTVQ